MEGSCRSVTLLSVETVLQTVYASEDLKVMRSCTKPPLIKMAAVSAAAKAKNFFELGRKIVCVGRNYA